MKRFTLLSSMVLCLLFAGCASPWVKKPQANVVKKIAIVSVFMNRDIQGDRGSKTKGGGLSFLKGVVGAATGTEEVDDGQSDMRIRHVRYAAKKYARALHKLPGWKVVMPIHKVAKHPGYRKLASPGGSEAISRVLNVAGKFAHKKMVTLPKMQAVDLSNGGSRHQMMKLKDLCDELNVDAVALVQVHLFLDESVWTFSTPHRSVRPRANPRIDLVTKRGEFAVRTAHINDAEDFEAEGSVWVRNGQLKFDNKAENRFREAVDKSINHVFTRLRKELKES